MEHAPFREIRAIHDGSFVRVYQAYSDEIADMAVAANSFEAPHAAGCWSDSRMTWIKPSAVWMAYRCGWTSMKDVKQARVLAIDLDRPRFEQLLTTATLSHGGDGATCKKSAVVVQWDPERVMHAAAEHKQVLTRGLAKVRSIQIGLRGAAVQLLLDPAFVLRISDVTPNFRQAAALLAAGDASSASKALWPQQPELPMQLPVALHSMLGMAEASAAAAPEAKCLQPPPEQQPAVKQPKQQSERSRKHQPSTLCVIAGSQTGADRAALRAARAASLSTAGVAPRGFKTEIGLEPSLGASFGLTECDGGYGHADRANVEMSDALIAFRYRVPRTGRGCEKTVHFMRCGEYTHEPLGWPAAGVVAERLPHSKKPILVLWDVSPANALDAQDAIAALLAEGGVNRVMVSGPCESTNPENARHIETCLTTAFAALAGPAAEP
uniref:Uncharacterized protein n=1 Tax=Calcidiscus leptoporus TaxID=127549 RepID=A0A7S0JBX1_9EUKA